MNINNLKFDKNFDNIYLFASGEYNNDTISKLENINFTDNDCIILFNKPSKKLLEIIKNRSINYSITRSFGSHLYNNSLEILNLNFNVNECFFISDHKDFRIKKQTANSDDKFIDLLIDKNISKEKIFSLENIIFNELKYIDFCKSIGYIIKEKNNNLKSYEFNGPSVGFIGILISILLYSDFNLILVGFTDFKNMVMKHHNHKFENQYLIKNNINYTFI